MKSIITILLIAVVAINVKASNSSNLNYLTEVNAQWSKQPEKKSLSNSVSLLCNKTFTDWISTHLMLVEQALRSRSTEGLSNSQKQNREMLLNKLNNYWHLKQFPINDYLSYKNPVFIDRKGTHCAVGYLMQQSGYQHLAKRIDATQKFAYIHQIKVKGVSEWANEFGFTIDELAWIQPGYPVNSNAQDLLHGVNGNVNAIVIDNGGSQYYVAGSFSQTTNGVNASNIACYLSGFAGWLWTDVNGGVNGTINAMVKHNNKLYVGGDFTMANGIVANHVAAYDLITGQWQNVGSLNGSVKCFEVYNNELYAGGNFTNFVAKLNGTNWINFTNGYLYGAGVRALKTINNQLYIGGNFELPTGSLCRHVAAYDGQQILNSGFGTPTPVNDFELHNGKIYAACDAIDGADTCALSVLNNGYWETIIKPNICIGDCFSGESINDLISVGNKLICGGSFGVMNGMTYGNNLMILEETSGGTIHDFAMMPILNTDSTINCLANLNDEIYFGGKFVTNSYTDTLNHIGSVNILISNIISTAKNVDVFTLYPNPTNDILYIKNNGNNIYSLEIIDAIGNVLDVIKIKNNTEVINLTGFAKGIYTAKANTTNGVVTKKIVRQ